PRSHKRLKHIKLRYHSIREYIEDGEVKICKVHTNLNVADPLTKALPRAKHDQHQNAMDPATYEEAMMSPDSNKWQEAMKSEMGSMYDNKVWTLVDLPDSRKAVENKWIFKRKTDADGNITVYKARLVAKGFRQIQGVDYDETFSVAKLKFVRILLAIAAFFDYEIWQMDVKTAFLNGDIEKELYMSHLDLSWASSKQCTVAKSSTESEYIAASEASSEAVWMKRFIVELGVVPSALDPLVIYCDNMGAIANAQESRSQKRLKHIKLRYHSIREYIEDGESNTWGSTYIMWGIGEGAGHHKPSSWPHPIVAGHPLSQTLAAPFLLHLSRTLSEAPPEISIATATTPSCYRIQGGATTSAARWNGEKDVVFINTERVTEYGGAARLWHRDQDLLCAFASGK
ncbi:hypothetical protein QYE76_036314, partial [Lolium multiflorum]